MFSETRCLEWHSLIILGYFASRHFENENIEIATFVAATVIGIPYLLIESNSKKYKL